MAKFKIEADSATKEAKFYVDDQEVSARDFSISKYTYKECDSEKETTSLYLSYSKNIDENTVYSHSVSFRDGSEVSYNESVTSYSVAKEIANIVENAIASVKLSNLLKNRKK